MAEESKVKKLSKKAKSVVESMSTLRKYRSDPTYDKEVKLYGKDKAEKRLMRAASLSAIETKAYTSTNIIDRMKGRAYLAAERGITGQFGTVGEIYRQSRRAPTKELAKQLRSDAYKRIFANSIESKFGLIGEVFATKIRSTIGTSFGEDPDKTFTKIKENFFSIAGEFKAINENFQKTDRKIEIISKRIDGTNKTIREDIRMLQNSMGLDPKGKTRIDASLEKVESVAHENESTIRNVEAKLGIEINRIDTVESRMTSMQDDINRIFIILKKTPGPGDNVGGDGSGSASGIFNTLSKVGGAAVAGQAAKSVGTKILGSAALGKIVHSILPYIGLAVSNAGIPGKILGVGGKILSKAGGLALGGAAAYGAYKYMGAGAAAQGMNLGALSGAMPGLSGMGDITGKMMGATNDLTKQMAGALGAGGIAGAGVKHILGLPEEESDSETNTTKKKTGADKLKEKTDSHSVQSPLAWLRNKVMGEESTTKQSKPQESESIVSKLFSRNNGNDTQAMMERARIEQEKARFMSFGALPGGFEYLDGHMGRLGQPGAVAASGAMPRGGGAGFGGSSGYGFASSGGGYNYSPPGGSGQASSRQYGNVGSEAGGGVSLKDISPHQLAYIRGLGMTETHFRKQTAYSDRMNQYNNNANVRKYGDKGADYGYYQTNQLDVEDAIRKGVDPEIAKHLHGGGKNGASTVEQQTLAMHEYLKRKYPKEYEGIKSGDPNAFEAARSRMAGQWFGLRDRPEVAREQFAKGNKSLQEIFPEFAEKKQGSTLNASGAPADGTPQSQNGTHISPVTGKLWHGGHGVTSQFGYGRSRLHAGADIYATDPKTGELRAGDNAHVNAPTDGKIVSIARLGNSSNAGNIIIFKDKHGYEHRFLHTSGQAAINPETGKPWQIGETIKQGQQVTTITGSGTDFGRTAESMNMSPEDTIKYFDKKGWGQTNKPHLHHEVKKNGSLINPQTGQPYINELYPQFGEAGINQRGYHESKDKMVISGQTPPASAPTSEQLKARSMFGDPIHKAEYNRAKADQQFGYQLQYPQAAPSIDTSGVAINDATDDDPRIVDNKNDVDPIEPPSTSPPKPDAPATPAAAGPGDAPLPGENDDAPAKKQEQKQAAAPPDRSGGGQQMARPAVKNDPESRGAEPGSGGYGSYGRCFV